MNRLWVIGDSKKALFPGKSVFIFLLSYGGGGGGVYFLLLTGTNEYIFIVDEPPQR